MPVEAIPISIESGDAFSPEGVAEAINDALKAGTYVGHIALTGNTQPGIVLLIDKLERTRQDILIKQDLVDNWNATGAGQAWRKLVRASIEYEDFPLKLVETKTGSSQNLVGDVSATLEWLRINPLQKSTGGVAVTILERLVQADGATA